MWHTCANNTYEWEQKKLRWAEGKIKNGEHTIPSTVAEELQFNPFMRVHEKAVAEAVGVDVNNPIEVMKKIRAKKDAY